MESLLKMLFVVGTEGFSVSGKSMLVALVSNGTTEESTHGNLGGVKDFG